MSLSWLGMAQTDKDSKLIGGTGTLHLGTGNFKGTLLVLTPRLGIFATNNFAMGAAVPLSLYAYEGSNTSAIGVSPFFWGYFGGTSTRFLMEARVGYQHYSYKTDTGNFRDSSNSFTYGAGIGLAHFISNHVGLEFILSYVIV